MAGVIPRFSGGPVTYPVTAKVTGGQVVEADGTGVKPAGANAVDVLGVAMTDALSSSPSSVTDDFSNPIVPTNAYPNVTTVAGPGFVIEVTYAANAAFGALLKAAANGTVTPLVLSGETPDDYSLVIGRCAEPGGVTTSTKATGLMRVGQ